MLTDEHIVYLSRKLNWTRDEIGRLHPAQAVALYNEVAYQESVEEWKKYYCLAEVLAAIYNTIPTKSHKILKAQDFIATPMPERNTRSYAESKINRLAREIGIRLPKEE